MDGLMEQTTARPTVRAQHYDTAMRHVRKSMQGLQWTQLLTASTRHYKTGKGLRGGNGIYGGSAMTAWSHAIDASPWVMPTPDVEAALIAGYVADDSVLRGDAIGLMTGAAALSELPTLRVIRIETIGQLQAWVQRIGPCVIGGAWSPEMDVVARDTEEMGRYEPMSVSPIQHAVAVVGIKPDAIRIVNNKGASWGALGRAWMRMDDAQALLERGEAWGVVPVDLTPKRSAK